MLHTLRDLRRHPIRATDGELGHPNDLVFDERDWRVCYLVAETGTWWRGKLALVPRSALKPFDERDGTIPVMLDREDLRRAAPPESEPTLPRRLQLTAYEELGWVPYSGGGYLSVERAPSSEPAGLAEGEAALRSAREIAGYRVAARDHDVGPVEDLVVDDDGWVVRYAVVDVRHWLPGREVLVGTSWIREMDWTTRRMRVDLTRDEVRSSPEFAGAESLHRGYEERLHDHYSAPKYWI